MPSGVARAKVPTAKVGLSGAMNSLTSRWPTTHPRKSLPSRPARRPSVGTGCPQASAKSRENIWHNTQNKGFKRVLEAFVVVPILAKPTLFNRSSERYGRVVRDVGRAIVLCAEHLEDVGSSLSEKDVVDGGLTLTPSIVGGTLVGLRGGFACIQEYTIQHRKSLIVGGNVEIAGEENRHIRRDKLPNLLACLYNGAGRTYYA